MSYIYNSCICEVCGSEIDYVWQLADGIFEVMPDRTRYVFADYDRLYKKYDVCVKCPKCKTVLCFEYSLDGKYTGKRG